MLIGEAEILRAGQDAYVQAQRALGRQDLDTLLRAALEAGRSARTHTAIAEDSTSIAGAAVACAKQHRARPRRQVGAGDRRWANGCRRGAAVQGRRRARHRGAEPLAQARTEVAHELGEIARVAEMPGAGQRAGVGRRRGHLDRRFALRPHARERRRGDARRGRSGRCSSSTSRCRATSIPTVARIAGSRRRRRRRAQRRRRRYARAAARSDPAGRGDHRRARRAVSSSGTNRASPSP